jgi:hypothetical protein
MTTQQAIVKRMAQIAAERAAGRKDCIEGVDPQSHTIEYTIGYGDEYQRQQMHDNLTSMQA